MKVLFLGDIVAKLGRQTVEKILPDLKRREKIDLCFANGENLAGGRGVTEGTLDEMMTAGIDYFTSGNHVFYQNDFERILSEESFRILRPANYLSNVPGRGYTKINFKKFTILLINLSGTSFMKGPLTDPFKTADEILEKFKDEKSRLVTIVDFHAETTSEKQALGFYLDGRVEAVLGTHTHVGTIDLNLLPKKTLFVSDIGMIGSKDSVLGVEKDIIINQQMFPYPQRFIWEEKGQAVFNSVLFEVGTNGGVKKSKRIDLLI